jgi:hypothetical protein
MFERLMLHEGALMLINQNVQVFGFNRLKMIQTKLLNKMYVNRLELL